ncbi:rhamnulokinase [Leucobacter ruminantium]|uniref:Rhamnulokinase n=1 Tax=Leucobacter ruminantium TaxID=1289170 RepID=A0A939RU75_9MICO|nr:FGGY-family carbohydrate kinase [Leucobacter ruminantium]MBO1805385.1 rhamnulokinase [Leucobacter ruminantium]
MNLAQPPGPGPRAYAAVDLGASSGRVVLGVASGGTWRFDELHRFRNGVSETEAGEVWDLERLFDETVAGLRLAAGRCTEHGYRFSGIGVDSWGVDWALRTRAGEIELPSLSYRGAPDPSPTVSTRGLGAAEVYEITGIPDQAINSGLRLAELARSRRFAGEQLLFVPDLWLHWLSGSVATDPTIASTSQLLDARTGEFSGRLLEDLGLTELEMPPVEPVGSVAGTLRPELAAAIGARGEVPVFRVAGHDTADAFAFADEQRASGEALISSGTWSIVGAAVSRPDTSNEAREAGFSNEAGAHGILLARNITGLWMLQECLREWGAQQELAPLLEAVRDRPFDARTFDTGAPELFGAGAMERRVREACERAGRPLDASRESVVHAIIDSLAAAYAAGVRTVERLLGRSLDRVRIVGGGSRNERLCRLTAELTGKPVLAGPAEASAIGNIAIQAAADGAVDHPADVFAALAADETHGYAPPNRTTADGEEKPA